MDTRIQAVALAGLMAVLGSGCSNAESSDAVPPAMECSDALKSTFEVVREPEVEEASERDANFSVDLSSSFREPLRITVRMDGRLAVDVQAPEDVCGLAPVNRFDFRVPPGSTTKVVVETSAGQRRSVNLTVKKEHRWLVVQPQEGFPLSVKVYDQEPQWG